MWNWQLLRAGALRLDGGGMFGVIPRTIWSRLVTADDNNRIALQTNCLLLQDGSQTVLVETGCGDKWTDTQRGHWDLERRTIVDALREVDIEPGQVDVVIVTHLHFDHAAALTRWDADNRPVPTFPNATVIVQETEWADALANKSTMGRTYLRSHLDPVADCIQLVSGDTEVLPGITVWPMVGHTWGHQAVRFDDGEGIVCFPGDVMPTVHHAGPAYSLGYDMLPYENMLSKQALLEQASRDNWRLVLDHEPGNPVVRVAPETGKAGRFRLVQEAGAG